MDIKGNAFGADCSQGVPGGPQGCLCTLNGVELPDGILGQDLIQTHGGEFWADDCKGVSQKLADGQCDRILNCCFTWKPQAMPGQTIAEQCSCLSDPTVMGVSTCQEVANLGGGKVVDLCPQYEQLGSTFPSHGTDGGP